MKSAKTYPGSCNCQTVRFEIVGEFQGFFFCHCTRCRKGSGSAHNANLFSTTAECHWLAGQESVKAYEMPGTRFVKTFCSNCGSALPTITPGVRILVPAGSLDCDVDQPPTAHIFLESRANWDKDLEQVVGFKGLP